MSEGFIRKLENRKAKKTLIAMCNLHHIMTSKIILDLYFGFLVCLRYKLIKEIIIVKVKRKDVLKEIIMNNKLTVYIFFFQSNYNFCMKKDNLQEHNEETFGKDESYETFVNEIKSMAEGIMQLSLQVVQIYTPIVNRIISDTSATQHEVEYLMDYIKMSA